MGTQEEERELPVAVTCWDLKEKLHEAERQGVIAEEDVQEAETAHAKALWWEEPQKASLAKAKSEERMLVMQMEKEMGRIVHVS